MPDFDNLPLILAGPLVRRVEPTSVSVWVALSKQSQVELGLWSGLVTATSGTGVFGNGSAQHTASATSIRIGEKLHLALVTLDLSASPLIPGQVYSYNLVFTVGGSTQDLNSLKLLTDDTSETHPHLALGYFPNNLPSFAMPPVSLQQLKIMQGSCRKAHGGGLDALTGLDKLIKDHLDDAAQRPQQLFLTGDQVYADDIASTLLPELNEAGNALLGVTEKLTIDGSANGKKDATLANFPATWRQELTFQKAKFSSHEAANHALSFGEYCALYLFFWSNVLWPDTLKTLEQVFTEPDNSIEAVNLLPPHLKELYPTDAEEREKKVESREEIKENFEDELARVKAFRKTLPKVRRALANIPSFMIFDDHEVTDDWFLVKNWVDQVLTSPLGVNVLRNGMLSYALFQGWGNDPKKFIDDASHAQLLAAAQNLFPAGSDGPDTAKATEIDALFGFDGSEPDIQWHYSVPSGPTQTLVLDTRTRRVFPSRFSPPGLISETALAEQIPTSAIPSAGAEVLIIVSAAPVLGLALIEELLQPIMARAATDFAHAMSAVFKNIEPEITGYMEWDMEAWSLAPVHFEALLARLQPMKKVVILSGDVHYAFSSELDYWKKGDPVPTRIVQLCASAAKNEWPQVLKRVLSTGTGQQLLHDAFYPMERMVWESDLDLIGEVNVPGGIIPSTFRPLLRISPVLLPTQGWPAGTTIGVDPDWSWRMSLVKDGRPDDASPNARPSDGQAGNITPDVDPAEPENGYLQVLQRHEKMLSNKIPRSVVHASNIGLITFSGTADTLKVKHDLMYPHPGGEKAGDPKAYTSHEIDLVASTDTPPSIG